MNKLFYFELQIYNLFIDNQKKIEFFFKKKCIFPQKTRFLSFFLSFKVIFFRVFFKKILRSRKVVLHLYTVFHSKFLKSCH